MPEQRAIGDDDIAVMQSLYDSDQHSLAYSYYAAVTGSAQADLQSQISNPDTYRGQVAMEANALVQNDIEANLGDGVYPGDGLHDFSREIFSNFFDQVKSDVASGGTGILSDQQMADSAYGVWASKGIGDYFPGNLPAGRWDTPGATDAFEAGAMWWTMPWMNIQGPTVTSPNYTGSFTPSLDAPNNFSSAGDLFNQPVGDLSLPSDFANLD